MRKLAFIALVIGVMLIPIAMAQTQITGCPDKCDKSTLYQKGILDTKLKICVYGIQEPCKFGCVNAKISTKPECALYPATLPENDTQAMDIIFQIVKDMYEREKVFGHISLFGTEYILGQNGTLFLKLLDSNELPINSGFCSVTMYYPNKTLKFMDNAPTAFLENGLYYKDFFVPTTEGLYIADASCVYADTVFRYNIPSENAGHDGAIGSGTSPQPLTFRDIDCTDFHTLGGGTYQNWTFNYASLGLINLSQITQIDLNWVGQISAANGNVQLYNWNTSAWDSIGASIASTGITLSCGNNVYLSRSTANNFTSYISNNTIKMRIYRAGTATMLTDAVEIIFHNNGSVVASLRGSSEVHVNSWFSNITASMNQTQFNALFTEINSVNSTANATLELLQNLTIGNVSVTANVNWTEGVQYIWNASGQAQISYSLLSLSNGGIQMVIETMACADNATLMHTMNVTNCVQGQCLDSVRNITETCLYGCANNACAPTPLNGALYFFAFIAVILVVAGIIYTRKR